MGAWTEERRGRDLCERCRRAREVSSRSLCAALSIPSVYCHCFCNGDVLRQPTMLRCYFYFVAPLFLLRRSDGCCREQKCRPLDLLSLMGIERHFSPHCSQVAM